MFKNFQYDEKMTVKMSPKKFSNHGGNCEGGPNIVANTASIIGSKRNQSHQHKISCCIHNTMKASFWGLFKTNFYSHFRKLFLFTKFNFLNFGKKFFLTYI